MTRVRMTSSGQLSIAQNAAPHFKRLKIPLDMLAASPTTLRARLVGKLLQGRDDDTFSGLVRQYRLESVDPYYQASAIGHMLSSGHHLNIYNPNARYGRWYWNKGYRA